MSGQIICPGWWIRSEDFSFWRMGIKTRKMLANSGKTCKIYMDCTRGAKMHLGSMNDLNSMKGNCHD